MFSINRKTLSIGAVFKNEAPYLREWIEYHRLVGVDHFYLYDEGSEDHAEEVLSPYIDEGIVSYRNGRRRKGELHWLEAQKRAYNHCVKRCKTRWLALIDVDEFLVGDIVGYLARLNGVGAVRLRWVLYGSSGLKKLPKGRLMIESLVMRAPDGYLREQGPDHSRFKCIVRPEAVSSYDIHEGTLKDGFKVLDGEGIRINHYWTRDECHFFEIKMARRLAFSPLSSEVFLEIFHDLNQVEDPVLFSYVSLLREKVFSPPRKSRFLKRWLPIFLFEVGKWGWYTLCKGWDWIRVVWDAVRLRSEETRYVLWLDRPGSVGGAELQVEIIAKQLKALVVISGDIEGGKNNLFVQKLEKVFFAGQWGFGAHMLRWIAPKGEICHFFSPKSLCLATAVKRRGFKVFYMETGVPENQVSLEEVDFVTAVSQAGLDRLRFQGPSCVIGSMIYPVKNKREEREGFHLLYLGRLTPIKRVDLLLEAFAKIKKQIPIARLTVAGSGELLTELKRHAALLKVEVEFTGWLEKEAVQEVLARADVVCLLSETEGQPNCLLEAMAMGVPVVATRVGGVAEIVESGVNGILIESHDEKALVESLFELARNLPLRQKLAQGALESSRRRKDPMEALRAVYGAE